MNPATTSTHRRHRDIDESTPVPTPPRALAPRAMRAARATFFTHSHVRARARTSRRVDVTHASKRWMDGCDGCDAMRARASPWWRRCATSVCDARPPVPRRWWWWWTNTVGTRPDERSGRVAFARHHARSRRPRLVAPSRCAVATTHRVGVGVGVVARASGVRDSSARLTVHDPARARRGRRVSAVGSRWVVG